ncbi:Na+/H+ antiporter subunit G [Novosphingobium sp.]|uniref:Na+/H+ antiporter subunit G n=1 Tax=Novosphingobium sp. TaxID=1874826 RepID=UPI00262582BC|nr:Na+/H+ antiporter subunit G [Novosphingobium sp.]
MSVLNSLADIAISAMIVIGATFALIGSWGMVRLPTLMERLHGPTKATTLGLGGMLVGSILFFHLAEGTWALHELLISLFLFITAPISANMIAKVHLHQLRVKPENGVLDPVGPAGQPPVPSAGSNWATYEAPHAASAAATSE